MISNVLQVERKQFGILRGVRMHNNNYGATVALTAGQDVAAIVESLDGQ